MKSVLSLLTTLAGALALAGSPVAQTPATADAARYLTPPAPIAQILDAPPTPTPSVSPRRDTIALLGRANLPPVAELAEPSLRLAGYRINPRNDGPANSRISWLNALSFQPVAGGAVRTVALPAGARFFAANWSPDGSRLAFLMDAPGGLDLWVADVSSGRARRVAANVNATFGSGYEWLPDSSGLLVRLVPGGRGAAPRRRSRPRGPRCRRTPGAPRPCAPTRTCCATLPTRPCSTTTSPRSWRWPA